MKYNELIDKAANKIKEADAILIGAGAGLSAADGLLYSGERFETNFADFIKKYPLKDMYSTAFYPFGTQEEKWAFWSRYIKLNGYDSKPGDVYKNLLKIVERKPYFVATTNADGLFLKSGFSEDNFFNIQGDYKEFQCSTPCHDGVYYNEEQIFAMVDQQKDCKIPSDLIPKCPNCGAIFMAHLRMDNRFIENEKWHNDKERYSNFIQSNMDKKLVLLELGIGFNTPGILRLPFEQMTQRFSNIHLVRINRDQVASNTKLDEDSAILIEKDIDIVFKDLLKEF